MPGKSTATLCANLCPQTKVEDEEAGISAMRQPVCKLWLAGIINTKIRLLEHKPNIPITIFSAYQSFPAEVIGIADAWLRKVETEPKELLHQVETIPVPTERHCQSFRKAVRERHRSIRKSLGQAFRKKAEASVSHGRTTLA